MPCAIRVDIHLGHLYEMCDTDRRGQPKVAAMVDRIAAKVKTAVDLAVREATDSLNEPFVLAGAKIWKGLPLIEGMEGVPVDDLGIINGADIPLGRPHALDSESEYQESRTVRLDYSFS